jgi:hypothetical protein
MEMEKGRTVRISYICRLKDGKAFPSEEKNLLQFRIGTGALPPTLEKALMGMIPGDQRTVHVPAPEVILFPFPKAAKPTPPGVVYDFGPGEGGDVAESIAGTRRSGELPPSGADVDFEIELLGVE